MSSAHSRLGALSVLAFAGPALAGEFGEQAAAAASTGKVPYRLSYETSVTDAGLEVKIYAQNQSDALILVDDDPYVEAAWMQLQDGGTQRLNAGFDADMMSRAGPRRRWMAVKPGERLLVGTSTLVSGSLEERYQQNPPTPGPVPSVGELSLKVHVVMKDRQDTVDSTVHVGTPTS
jgi:hypothetical protein